MKEAYEWKKYKALNAAKSGLYYSWCWSMEKLGKSKSQYSTFPIKAVGPLMDGLRPVPKYAAAMDELAGKTIMGIEDAYELIADKIMSQTPFFAGRFGSVELNMIVQVLNVRYGSKIDNRKAALEMLCMGPGFFPKNMKLGERFVNLMLKELSNIDLHGVWPLYMEEYLVNRYAVKAQLTDMEYMEPFHISRESKTKPWSHALAGRKVLIIHPFVETIEQQYYNHRKEIFKKIYNADDILPEFELKTLKAVQTIAGNRDERFDTWFDALKWMKDECRKIDFDVAILGCGGYGFPLASEIKRMGKISIYVGGGTQLLFGIKGRRWEDADFGWYRDMVNESWVRPNENEKIKGRNKVENGCYW